MLKKVIVALVVLITPFYCFAKYSGGSGASGNPYKIATPQDLSDIGNHTEDFNKCFLMTADINLSQFTGAQFKIIGSVFTPFSGVFDGDDHKIYNFSFITSDRDNTGLFGVTEGAIILNLGIINPDVNAGQGENVGAIAGKLDWYSEMNNCYVEGGKISGYSMVGGLVGTNGLYHSAIQYCRASAEVNGVWYAGGLVGYNFDSEVYRSSASGLVIGTNRVGGLAGDHSYGHITECFATGNVMKKKTSTPNFHGGLVGYLDYGYIQNSYASGSVTGLYEVGGLVGEMRGGEVNDCFSTGFVSGSDTGGLIRYKDSYAKVYNSFWDINSSGQLTSGGGTGKTTVQMKLKLTFTDAGWDFNNVWHICETTNYPKLLWQVPAGDIVCPYGVDTFDIAELSEEWLTGQIPADLAPPDGDGIVNFADFAIMANDWLKGF
jgi:hypothetical protein